MIEICIDLVITIALYTHGPLLFAHAKKRPTTKGVLKGFCVGYTALVWLLVNAIKALLFTLPVGGMGPAFLWGAISYHVARGVLDRRGRLLPPGAAASPMPNAQTKPVEVSTGAKHPERLAQTPVAVTPAEPTTVHFDNSDPVAPNAPVKVSRRPRGSVIAFWGVIAVAVIAVALLVHTVAQLTTTKNDLARVDSELTSVRAQLSATEIELKETKQKYIEELADHQREVESTQDRLAEANTAYYFLQNKIGFITSESRSYHNFECPMFTDADEFWAHNIEYCEYLGYSPCSNCW